MIKYYIPKLPFGNVDTLKYFFAKMDIGLHLENLQTLQNADGITVVIPGNGNWAAYLESGVKQLLEDRECRNYICICGALQILCTGSEEAPGKGVGIIDRKVEKLQGRIPNLGLKQVENNGKFYFANSYGVPELNSGFDKLLTYENASKILLEAPAVP